MTEELAAGQLEENAEMTWEDTRDHLIDCAQKLEGDGAFEKYCEAILLIERKTPGAFQIVELWNEALDRVPGAALKLWNRLGHRLSTNSEFWTDISESFQVASESAEGDEATEIILVWGLVQLMRSDEAEEGLAHLAEIAGSNEIAAQITEIAPLLESPNWRKIEKAISEQLKAAGLNDPELKVATALRTADIALGAGETARAMSIVQAVEKSKKNTPEGTHFLRLLYRHAGKWTNYINMLKAAIEKTDDLDEKVDLFLEMVNIYKNEMKADAQVVKTYEALLSVKEDYFPAYDALEEIYGKMRRFPDVVKVLQRRLKIARNDEETVDINLKIAKVYIDNLNRKNNAIEFFENILSVDSAHAYTVEQLKEIYDQPRYHDKLVALYRSEISRIDDEEQRIERLREVADIATKRLRKTPEVAIGIWRQVYDAVPDDMGAIEALDELYRKQKDWTHVAEICERKAELADDEGDRLKHWEEVGSIYDERIKNREGAIRAWREVLDLDPEHKKGEESLKKLLIAEKSWQDLEDFYEFRDYWEPLAKLFEKESRRSKETDETIDLLFRAGRIWRDELGDNEKAAHFLEEVLKKDKNSQRAAVELTPIYKEQEEHASFAEMVTIQLGHIQDIEARLPLEIELAECYEKQLSKPKQAFEWFSTALAANPTHTRLYDDLQRAAEQSGQHEETVQQFKSALEKVSDDVGLQRSLRLRIGRELGDHLDKVDEALSIFETVLEEEQDNTEALAALEGLLERTGRFDQLIDVNTRRLELTKEPKARGEILFTAARIHEHQRKDIETAINVYQDIQELLGEDVRPLVELRRLYRISERWEELTETLRSYLDLMQMLIDDEPPPTTEVKLLLEEDDEGMPIIPDGLDADNADVDDNGNLFIMAQRPVHEVNGGQDPRLDETVPLWFELGQVVRVHLSDADDAITSFDQVIALDIDHDGARGDLELLLDSEEEQADRIAKILEPVYISGENHEALIKVLRVQVANSANSDTRHGLFVRIGEILSGPLDRKTEGFTAFKDALVLHPGDSDLREQLETLAEVLDIWSELADGIAEVAEDIEDNQLKTDYYLKLAEICEEHLKDNERAIEQGRKALETGAEFSEVLEQLETFFDNLDAWPELVAVMRAQIELIEDPEAHAALKLRIADVTENNLGDKATAIEVYLEITGEDPENDDALLILDRLYEEMEQWSELANNLEVRSELKEEGEERDDILCKLAQTLHHYLDDHGRAIDIFQDVLERDSEKSAAIETMRLMLTKEDLHEFAETIAEVLLPIYDEKDEWMSHVEVNEQRILATENPAFRVELLHEIAELFTTYSEDYEPGEEAANLKSFETYKRALPEDPLNETTLEQLDILAGDLERWPDLIQKMEAVIAIQIDDDPEAAHALLVLVANAQRDNLDALDASVDAFERAHGINEGVISVIEALEGLYETLERWQKLIDIISHKVTLIDEDDVKKTILYRAAEVCENHLGEDADERAIGVYKDVFAIDDNDSIALKELARLYTKTTRWDDLMEVLSIQLDQAQEEEERAAFFHQQAIIFEEKLDNDEEAINALLQVLDIDSEDLAGLVSLDRLYLRAEDFESLHDILEREEELAEEPEDLLTLRYRRGEVQHRHLDNLSYAIELYESILQDGVDPDELFDAITLTVKALEEVIANDDEDALQNKVAAAIAVESAYRDLGEWPKLVAVLAILFDDADDPERQLELTGLKADIQEKHLKEPSGAFETWILALKMNPESDLAWESLHRISADNNYWERMVAEGCELFTSLDDPSQMTAVVRNIAMVYSKHLNNNDEAIKRWSELLEEDPGHIEAIDALDALLGLEKRWADQAEIITQKIEACYDDEDIVTTMKYRLGLLYAGELDDTDRAIDEFREVLNIKPGHEDATEALQMLFKVGISQLLIADEILIPYYQDTEQWRPILDLQWVLLEHEEKDSDARYDLLLEMADTYSDNLEEHVESLKVYGLALKERPDDDLSLSRIQDFAEGTGAWAQAIHAYEEALPKTEDVLARQELFWRIAFAYHADAEKVEETHRLVYAERQFAQYLGYALPEDEVTSVFNGMAPLKAAPPEEASPSEESLEDELPSEQSLFLEGDSDDGFIVEPEEDLFLTEDQPAISPTDISSNPGILAFLREINVEQLQNDLDPIRVIETLQFLDAIYLKRSLGIDLTVIIRHQIEATFDRDDRIALLLRLGTAHTDMLSEIDAAEVIFQEALDLNPESYDSFVCLAGIYEMRGDFKASYNLMHQRAEAVLDDVIKTRLWAKMANLSYQHLSAVEDALRLWFQILEIRGEDIESLQALETIYYNANEWPHAISVLERQRDRFNEIGEEENTRDALKRVATLCRDKLDDLKRALPYWRHALHVDPKDLEVLEAIKHTDEQFSSSDEEDIALEAKEDLVEILTSILGLGVLPTEVEVQYYFQLAHLLTDELHRNDHAIQIWESLLQYDPEHTETIDTLETLYRAQELWTNAANIRGRKAELASHQGKKIEHLIEASKIWSNGVGDHETAIENIRAVLELESMHVEAFDLLEEELKALEQWELLHEELKTRISNEETPEKRLVYLLRDAKIIENQFKDPERAFESLISVLNESWQEKSLSLGLEELAQITGNWDLLVQSYQSILAEYEGTREAIVLHNTFGRWYYLKVEPADFNKAWTHFQEALKVDPRNLDAFGGLAEIYKRLNNINELVGIQAQRAEILNPEDPEECALKVEVYKELGELWEVRLENIDNAISAYREALKFSPNDLPTTAELQRIYQSRKDWPELVDILERRVLGLKEAKNNDEAITTLYQVGQLWEQKLSNNDKAIDAYQRLVELEPKHIESLSRLEKLLTKAESWKKVLKIHQLQLKASDREREQIVLLDKMSRIYEEKLDRPEDAIKSMQKIGAINPDHVPAVQNLERLFQGGQNWRKLAETLENHIDLIQSGEEQAQLFIRRGILFRDHLNNKLEAIDNFNNILAFDPKHEEALRLVSDSHCDVKDWDSAIESLQDLDEVVTLDSQKVEIKHRIGKLYQDKLGLTEDAETYYQAALRNDRSHIPSIDALRGIFEAREEYENVIRMLKQKVSYTQDLEERADLFCNIGRIYELQLESPINAIDYYKQTIELSPDNPLAARPLAEMYIREKKWARAETLLGNLVGKLAHRRDVEDLYQLFYWLGLSNEQLGQTEAALRNFREAYERNPHDLQTLIHMGRILYKNKDYERAYNAFQSLLMEHGESLEDEEQVEILFDCGDIQQSLGDVGQAQQLYHTALEINSTHLPSLNAMIALCEQEEQWEHLVHYKHSRLSVVLDTTKKLTELISIGDLLLQKLNREDEAIDAYKQAMDIRSDSKIVLNKLFQLYQKSQQWVESIDIITRLLDLTHKPNHKARIAYTIAILYRDRIGDTEKALEFFNKTLDADINELKAFEAIDRILTSQRDWQSLQRNYRKLIKRVYDADEGQFEDTKFLLWYSLGETYRSRLNDFDSALSSFIQASNIRPKEVKVKRILADLYIRTQRFDEAIETYRNMLLLPPADEDLTTRNAEFYHALFGLYLQTQHFDRAWCITNLTAYLKVSTPQETEYHNRYLTSGLVNTQGRFTNEIWALIYHPTKNMRINNVMSILQAQCRDLYAYDLRKTWGMRKKNILSLNANFTFCKVYSYLAGIMGVVPAPTLYSNREQPLGMINGNINPPGFIIGTDMMEGRTQRDLAFIIARQLTLAMPQHYLGALRLPTEMLKFLMMGAIQAASGGNVADENLATVVKMLHKMSAPLKIDLGKMMRPIISGQVPVNMSQWLKSLDYTANRVGLLLSGDLNIAMRAVRNDNQPISKLTSAEKREDLLEFCISDSYFELRERLGLSVD